MANLIITLYENRKFSKSNGSMMKFNVCRNVDQGQADFDAGWHGRRYALNDKPSLRPWFCLNSEVFYFFQIGPEFKSSCRSDGFFSNIYHLIFNYRILPIFWTYWKLKHLDENMLLGFIYLNFLAKNSYFVPKMKTATVFLLLVSGNNYANSDYYA